jgi:HAD superfamily hydrolase (TIGR01509 family)
VAIRAVGFDYVGVVAYPEGGRPGLDDRLLHLVSQLRAGGYQVGLLSNLGKGWTEELLKLGLDEYFDPIMVSGDIGYTKPDPRAFALFAEHMGVSTHELLYVDDNLYSLSGVEELGVTPVVYRGYDQLVASLRQHGVSWD